jgi:separase
MGTSISYLLGGAPFVIGNLWDVTDKDIDKLSIQCMSSVFDNSDDGVSEGNQDCDKISVDTVISVSKSLSLSRGVCKLKAAVGFAPVMYGLPMVVDCR